MFLYFNFNFNFVYFSSSTLHLSAQKSTQLDKIKIRHIQSKKHKYQGVCTKKSESVRLGAGEEKRDCRH